MAHENWNKESSLSQKAQVKKYLMDGNKITPLEALNLFGSLRLAAIVFDLREEGMNIKTEKIMTPSGKYVAEYSLTTE